MSGFSSGPSINGPSTSRSRNGDRMDEANQNGIARDPPNNSNDGVNSSRNGLPRDVQSNRNGISRDVPSSRNGIPRDLATNSRNGLQRDVPSNSRNGVPRDSANNSRSIAPRDLPSNSRNGIPRDLPKQPKDDVNLYRACLPREMNEKEAEESLSLYCKPVELYNIIQQRSENKPLFLQRCLSYKLNAAMRRRVKMTLSITGSCGLPTGRSRARDVLPSNGPVTRPIFVMVTRPLIFSDEGETLYRLGPMQRLKIGVSTSISFILPEVRKLVQHATDGDIVLFVIGDSVDVASDSFEHCAGRVRWGKLSLHSLLSNWVKYTEEDGPQWGAENGTALERTTNVDFRPAYLQIEDAKQPGKKHIRIRGKGSAFFEQLTVMSATPDKSLFQLGVLISAAEMGQIVAAKEKPASGSTSKAQHLYALAHSSRIRIGRVIFHYLYYHGMLRKTEVTERFSCPFCLTRCASFKGLQGHLDASHDLFKFEYLDSDELLQVVNVTCRAEVVESHEGTSRDVDNLSARNKNFAYWLPGSRVRRRKLPKTSANHLQDGEYLQSGGLPNMLAGSHLTVEAHLPKRSDVEPSGDSKIQIVDTAPAAAVPALASEQRLGELLPSKLSTKTPNSGVSIKGARNGANISSGKGRRKAQDPDSLTLVVKQRSSLVKKRQRMKGVLADRTGVVRSRPRLTFGGACASASVRDLDDCGQQQGLSMASKALVPDIPRTHALLQKRSYYHSHTAQPMDAEQLFGDKDSEDELDPEVADLEDRRMLDDFVDVTAEEKEVMHLWNSFVRRNRVVADGHCPWACGEFSKENAQRFGENPALRTCLQMFLIKLWNHHLVDAQTIAQCLATVDSCLPGEQREPKK